MENKLVAATNSKVSNYIPEDISILILSKLPVKSLKRFECVRKSWSLLFRTYQFMTMFYLNLFSNSRHGSYYDGASIFLRVFEHNKYDIYSLSGKRFENKVKLDCLNRFANDIKFRIYGFGSINGILCLYESLYCGKIVLWNPNTHEIKSIPPSPIDLVESFIADAAMDIVSFDVMYFLHGFGYDDRIDDYKVISYVYLLEDYPLHPLWVIYSIRNNSWRKLDVDMPYSLDCFEGTQVYLDGVCHWFCDEETSAGSLVSFYLSNEVFVITPIPCYRDYLVFDERRAHLVVLNEYIALISYHQDMNFHISILGEIGIEKSWTKLLIIRPLFPVERPIGIGTKGEIFYIRKDEELVWLDLSIPMIEEVGYKEKDCRIIIYKESKLPIGGISN
ncbi:F-box protein At1g11270-like [Trifolium pratense]|uniref:F-box protein At1g11270-like n=1 Tax=Trifolium pratense TaxID=57577 RepID=UPI001E69501B|nr:F-box protein At1g11270-like [Trifolium pratense]